MEEQGGKRKGDGLQIPMRPGPPKMVYTTWGDMAIHWPKTTILIISNEFCERFSFYGMRTVLTFYILNVLKFDGPTSTIFFNSFTILCYFTPLLGAIVADGFIGKFWTIFFVSMLYAAGQVLLAISSIQNSNSSLHPVLDLIGLITIGFGTGGIKPCVAPFGADQFDKGQDRMISVYFSMFYFSINAGAMISTFVSPIFRSTPCLGQDSCYPLCFGVPAILMIVATGVFMAGSFWYDKPPVSENVFAEVARIIVFGIRNAIRGKGPKRAHVIEHYLDTHDCEYDMKCQALKESTGKRHLCHKKRYVGDVQSLLRVLIMFVPIIMFFALYDQQGSTWLLQGIQMDCNVGGVLFLPDQMQTLNAVLILVFIPLSQAVVYPLVGMFMEVTPLRKMVFGGWLAALSFVATGLVQLEINTTLPDLPKSDQAFISFMNVYENKTGCSFTVRSLTDPTLPAYVMAANTSMIDDKDNHKSTYHVNASSHSWSLEYNEKCNAGNLPANVSFDFTELTKERKKDNKHTNMFLAAVGPAGVVFREVATDKPTDGTGEFNFGLTLSLAKPYTGNMAVCRLFTDDFDKKNPCNPQSPADFYYWETDYNGHTNDIDSNIPFLTKNGNSSLTATSYVFKSVKPGIWGLYFLHNTPKDIDNPPTKSRSETNVTATGVTFEINGQGGVYAFVVTGPGYVTVPEIATHTHHVWQVVLDNKVSILWQVPQFAILTAAEISLSVTGYEFAYSQTAPSMKAVVQALWLVTDAIGNFVIVGITAADLFDNMAIYYFAYAGAAFIVFCILGLLAIFYYEYNYFTRADDDEEEEQEEEDTVAPKFIDNKAFVPDNRDEEIAWR